jgi:hypothetical protein
MNKCPCRYPRVLDESVCPPSEGDHFVEDYPEYYDALYFPQLNTAVFETCATLTKSA